MCAVSVILRSLWGLSECVALSVILRGSWGLREGVCTLCNTEGFMGT